MVCKCTSNFFLFLAALIEISSSCFSYLRRPTKGIPKETNIEINAIDSYTSNTGDWSGPAPHYNFRVAN